MKRIVYLLITVAFLGSCATTTKTTEVTKAKPIPPKGVTFTKVENLYAFASIQMPFEGNGFGKWKSSSNENDTGEIIRNIKYKGSQVFVNDKQLMSNIFKAIEDKSDINNVLEGFKSRGFLSHWLSKDNVIQEYSDVVIGGKTCKRVFVSYNWDDSTDFYTLAYIVPHHKTTVMFYIDQATTSPAILEEDVKVLDNVFKYMIETVEFREEK